MTLVFWLIAWAMTLLVLGLLLWPILKRQESTAQEEGEKTLSVYRQQFAELEQDHRHAALTDEQYQQSKRELERRLLEETGPVAPTPAATRQPVNRLAIAVALAVVIPTLGGVLYWKLGNPLAITHPTASSPVAQGRDDSDHQTSEGLDALSEKLKKKLEQNPNDGVGWALLARSYAEIGRHADAVPIYEKAMTLIPDDPQLLADYADALGMLQGRTLNGKPEQLIQQALKIDPKHVKSLMLAGTIAFDRREFGQAAQYWERAQANLSADVDSEAKQELLAAITEAKGLAAGKPAAANVAGTSVAPSKPSGQAAAISGMVTLAPALAAKGAPTDTLFVFAREMNGPPMPVSIVRATKKELPFTFTLDDSTSPMPSRTLSDVGSVVIVARLSKSGEAKASSGDLQGMSQPVKPGAKQVTVVIDQEVP
ncbi:MAG: c-type cytochrome biogenesis protein CcmI [Nitrospira sp.]|jgi:cytochrome c-type biogenesis protein CcmH|nr:c-type cytochrome biogenesis protein CcmI [Nitrospira sp.]